MSIENNLKIRVYAILLGATRYPPADLIDRFGENLEATKQSNHKTDNRMIKRKSLLCLLFRKHWNETSSTTAISSEIINWPRQCDTYYGRTKWTYWMRLSATTIKTVLSARSDDEHVRSIRCIHFNLWQTYAVGRAHNIYIPFILCKLNWKHSMNTRYHSMQAIDLSKFATNLSIDLTA